MYFCENEVQELTNEFEKLKDFKENELEFKVP